MELRRGDRVLVRGMGGDEAVMVVWEPLKHGNALLTTEQHVARLVAGEDAPYVGYPRQDIVRIMEREA